MIAIVPVEERGAVIGWDVSIEEHGIINTCVVLVQDLIIPGFPTAGQIEHIARIRFAPPKPPKPIKRRLTERTIWTAAHGHCQAAANQYSVDVDKIVECLPDALGMVTGEWESRELAKRQARQLTGLTARDCAKIEEQYRDYSTVPHFDEHTQELAMMHPELNWNSWENNGQAMWELLSEQNKRKPSKFAPETIERAAELAVHSMKSAFDFDEWNEETTDAIDPEFVPF